MSALLAAAPAQLLAAPASSGAGTYTNRPENAELSSRAKGAPPTRFRLPGAVPRWARLGLRERLGWLLGRGFSNKQTIFKPGDHPLGDRSMYNAALTTDHEGHLVSLPRMEQNNADGTWTSRVGLATSIDQGKTWTVAKEPALAPSATDPAHIRKTETAGIEDPRATWLPEEKEYVVTYSAVERLPNGDLMPRLAIARGKDLGQLRKQGPVFADGQLAKAGIRFGGANHPDWSKAGAMLSKKLVASDEGLLAQFTPQDAAAIRGKRVYGMYLGDTQIYFAVSLDGVKWMPTKKPVLTAVPGEKYGLMVEPGPSPLYDTHGNLHFFFNADGNKGPLYPGGYALFEAVFDAKNPTRLTTPLRKDPLIRVTRKEEKTGQVNAVVFTPGVVVEPKTGDLIFSSGMADSKTELIRVRQSHDPARRLSQPQP